jgi:hypothetical protein
MHLPQEADPGEPDPQIVRDVVEEIKNDLPFSGRRSRSSSKMGG